LAALGYERVSRRTIYRVLRRHDLTLDRQRVRLKPALHPSARPPITGSGQWQQMDFIGPRYLRGSAGKIYFLVLRDAYDQAVYVEVASNRLARTVLDFLIRGWQQLGRPARLGLDNASEFSGSLRHRRTFSRVVRVCLLLGVEPVFIPHGEAWYQGGVENFNGLVDRLFYRAVTFRSLAHIRRELPKLVHQANHQHPHRRLGDHTSAEVRRQHRPRRLPNTFTLPAKLPLAAGRVSFIRRVRRSGHISIFNEKFFVGRRRRGQYLWATIFTKSQTLKVYHQHRLIKTFDYRLPTT
jgi:transposase InsO family protein